MNVWPDSGKVKYVGYLLDTSDILDTYWIYWMYCIQKEIHIFCREDCTQIKVKKHRGAATTQRHSDDSDA